MVCLPGSARRSVRGSGTLSREQAASLIQSYWRMKDPLTTSRTRRASDFALSRWGLVLNIFQDLLLLTKQHLYDVLFLNTSSLLAKSVNGFILTNITLSIVCFCMDTMPELRRYVDKEFWWITEAIFTSLFTIEYILRLWVCNFEEPMVSRWKFLLEAFNIADFVSLLPFYIDLIVAYSSEEEGDRVELLRVFRIFRLLRVFRVFKLGRHSRGMRLMFMALTNSINALVVLVFLLLIALLLYSSCIYFAERMSCAVVEPYGKTVEEIEKEENLIALECNEGWRNGWSSFGLCCDKYGSPNDFPSIMHGFWWALVTMTTVGYGDVYPRTLQGRIVGVFAILNGILVIALPVAIVGRKFQEVYDYVEMHRLVEMEQEAEEKERKMSGQGSPKNEKGKKLLTPEERMKKLEKCGFLLKRTGSLHLIEDDEEVEDSSSEESMVSPASPTSLSESYEPTMGPTNVARAPVYLDSERIRCKLRELKYIRFQAPECDQKLQRITQDMSDYQDLRLDLIRMQHDMCRRSYEFTKTFSDVIDVFVDPSVN